jgi:sigma54-dependent transcription regulator
MTTTTHTPSPGRPPHSPNALHKTDRHLYTKDAHRNDDKPVDKCRTKLARFGLTKEDVQAQVKKEGMHK